MGTALAITHWCDARPNSKLAHSDGFQRLSSPGLLPGRLGEF